MVIPGDVPPPPIVTPVNLEHPLEDGSLLLLCAPWRLLPSYCCIPAVVAVAADRDAAALPAEGVESREVPEQPPGSLEDAYHHLKTGIEFNSV